MKERILGPSGGRRERFWRRRLLFLPVAIAGIAFFVGSALAVHNLGLFELDRNAQDSNGAATLPDDWDTLYNDTTPPAGHSTVFTGIVNDTIANDQFQGGGSKDNNDINQWIYKAGDPLDKDDITNAYAAGYVTTQAGNGANLGDFIAYFGLDRFSNDGSAQVGFWFLKGTVAKNPNDPGGGGFHFTGTHQNGDVLIQSNFEQGGAVDSVSIFKWLNGSLVPVASAEDCLSSSSDDDVCATVNQSGTDSPWPYTPKSGSANVFPQGSFFEGGINLTQEVPGSGCFNTFVAETRSSTPFDSRLKDFALGKFNTCRANVDTNATPGGVLGTPPPPGTNQQPGVSASDTAIVTGTNSAGGTADAPKGTVDFYLCGPGLATAANATTGCPTGGTKVGGTKTLPPGAPNDNTNFVTSDSTSGATPPVPTTGVGLYCWRAEYHPATGSPYSETKFTNNDDECFITVAQPASVTTRQFVFPQDRATIVAPSGVGGNLAGNVFFRLFDTLANCQADLPANGGPSATGLKFASGAIPVSGATTVSKKTDNTSFSIDSTNDGNTQLYYWHVIYDSTNAAQTDTSSDCTENTQVTFGGDDDTITVPGPAN